MVWPCHVLFGSIPTCLPLRHSSPPFRDLIQISSSCLLPRQTPTLANIHLVQFHISHLVYVPHIVPASLPSVHYLLSVSVKFCVIVQIWLPCGVCTWVLFQPPAVGRNKKWFSNWLIQFEHRCISWVLLTVLGAVIHKVSVMLQ